ncbi:MAG TPA: alanine/ornithine racemase family PLP-dependent enzyme [Firmicutes bacterium]|nr:alanine/ornithine racemase family PLP-dependent enzyme [Bacillota bacterium]
MYPRLCIDLGRLQHNAKSLLQLASPRGISIWGVTKVLCGAPAVGEALRAAGITTLADSRLDNLRKLPTAEKVLLRLPDPHQAESVVRYADWSLNSELTTLQALSQAAIAAGKRHKVLLMVDVGDLREGLWPDEVIPFVRQALGLPGIQIGGLGTNVTCYGGVLPDPTNLGVLVELATELKRLGLVECEVISGGNSSSLELLQQGKIPRGINNLRLGESIILGQETIARRPLPGLFTDAVMLQAVAIEVKEKPSLPIGTIGQDAFGNSPEFVDLGVRRRVILALGRQDVRLDGLLPLEPGVRVLGASSDHLLLDTSDYPEDVRVGQVFSFGLDYGALLAASTSPYVVKEFRKGGN